MNEIVISTVLCNILVGCFCLLVLSWAATAINMLICKRKDDKRKEAAELRDQEYHAKRMESYK